MPIRAGLAVAAGVKVLDELRLVDLAIGALSTSGAADITNLTVTGATSANNVTSADAATLGTLSTTGAASTVDLTTTGTLTTGSMAATGDGTFGTLASTSTFTCSDITDITDISPTLSGSGTATVRAFPYTGNTAANRVQIKKDGVVTGQLSTDGTAFIVAGAGTTGLWLRSTDESSARWVRVSGPASNPTRGVLWCELPVLHEQPIFDYTPRSTYVVTTQTLAPAVVIDAADFVSGSVIADCQDTGILTFFWIHTPDAADIWAACPTSDLPSGTVEPAGGFSFHVTIMADRAIGVPPLELRAGANVTVHDTLLDRSRTYLVHAISATNVVVYRIA